MPRIFALLFLVLSALHVHWALGGRWPTGEERSLARLVVGGTDRMPGPMACFLVALALMIPATVLLIPRLLPSVVTQGVIWGTALSLFLRGLGGFFEARLRPAIQKDPYAHWNQRLYSPSCLLLAIGMMFTGLAR